MFFFEKKNQKTFATLTRLVGTGRDSGESFLLLFFKKEALLPPPMPEPHIIIPPPEATGQRADRFLAEAIGTLSRSRIKTLIESGHATRDGTLFTQPADPIRPGATYTITPPDPVSAIPQAQSIPFTILFEDRHLIVLDKPAGLVVHPAPGNQEGTLVNALLAHCGDTLPGIGGERRIGWIAIPPACWWLPKPNKPWPASAPPSPRAISNASTKPWSGAFRTRPRARSKAP
jgi:hypothetical protein